MKILAALILTIILFSCDDFSNRDFVLSPDPTLKSIHYSNDTVYLLCGGCPPQISFKKEDFFYDPQGRLSLRRLTTTNVSPGPTRIDTTATYVYSYAGSNSSLISGYTDTHRAVGTINHVLAYDSQGRLISDSVTNPQVSNNKVSLFQYLAGYVVEYDRQTDAVLTMIVRDTFYISGTGVMQERFLANTTHRVISHTLSIYRNPLSYVNNFLLFASDYKNETGLISFPIYYPQNITYYFPVQTDVSYWTNPASVTQYSTGYAITVDAQNRIQSYTNSTDYKTAYFEYY